MRIVTGRQIMRSKMAERTLPGFNKAHEPGDTLRVFFPVYWADQGDGTFGWDIVTGYAYGHSIGFTDGKLMGIKRSFIPTNAEIEVDISKPGKAKVIKEDVLSRFSKISRLVVETMYHQAINNKVTKKNLNTIQSSKVYNELAEEFDINKESVIRRKIVGPLTLSMCADVVSGKLVKGSLVNVGVYSISPSINQLTTLYDFLQDPNYAPKHEEGKDTAFLEVQYKYSSTVEKGAGSLNISGVPESERSEVILEDFEDTVKTVLDRIVFDSEVMTNHNYNFQTMEDDVILERLTAYINNQELDFDLLEEKSEQLSAMTDTFGFFKVKTSKFDVFSGKAEAAGEEDEEISVGVSSSDEYAEDMEEVSDSAVEKISKKKKKKKMAERLDDADDLDDMVN